jgi:hypothetical protein
MAVNEMEVLAASMGKEITIMGETIIIKPYSWANTIKMAKPLSVVLNMLFTNYDALEKMLKDNKDGKNGNIINQIMELSAFVGDLKNADELIDALIELMAVASSKDKEFVTALLADDALTLGRTVFEVNKDFFTKRLAKMMPAKPQKKQKK